MEIIRHIGRDAYKILGLAVWILPVLAAYFLWIWTSPLSSIPGALVFIFLCVPAVFVLSFGIAVLSWAILSD